MVFKYAKGALMIKCPNVKVTPVSTSEAQVSQNTIPEIQFEQIYSDIVVRPRLQIYLSSNRIENPFFDDFPNRKVVKKADITRSR